MAIKKFNDYDTTKSYSDYQPLPTGGYVLRIMDAKVEENQIGQYIRVRCDIAEGDYANYFMNDYQNQNGEDKKWHCNYLLNVPNDDGSEKDGWTKRKFKTFTEALEDSNEGYHFDWDETKFKDKLIGGLFNEREYRRQDGQIGRVTNLAQVTSIDKIRSGDFRVPKDKLIDGGAPQQAAGNDEFMNVPENTTEVPFD